MAERTWRDAAKAAIIGVEAAKNIATGNPTQIQSLHEQAAAVQEQQAQQRQQSASEIPSGSQADKGSQHQEPPKK